MISPRSVRDERGLEVAGFLVLRPDRHPVNMRPTTFWSVPHRLPRGSHDHPISRAMKPSWIDR